MVAAKILQIIWAAFLVSIFGILTLASPSLVGVTFGVISIVYFVATLACLANSIRGWIVALAFPILPLLRWTPMVVVNTWMFFTGHELYRDSPATIFVVATYAVIFVIPGFLIYLCLILDLKRLLAVLLPPNPIIDIAESASSIVIETTSPNPYAPPRT